MKPFELPALFTLAGEPATDPNALLDFGNNGCTGGSGDNNGCNAGAGKEGNGCTAGGKAST